MFAKPNAGVLVATDTRDDDNIILGPLAGIDGHKRILGTHDGVKPPLQSRELPFVKRGNGDVFAWILTNDTLVGVDDHVDFLLVVATRLVLTEIVLFMGVVDPYN